jgi:hypothetical protein
MAILQSNRSIIFHYIQQLFWFFFVWLHLIKNILSKFIIFRIKGMFEANALINCVKKWISSTSSVFFFVVNIKILFNFENECCTFYREMFFWKKTYITTFFCTNIFQYNIINFLNYIFLVIFYNNIKKYFEIPSYFWHGLGSKTPT